VILEIPEHKQVVGLAHQRHDRAIGVDGSAFDDGLGGESRDVGDLDGGRLFAELGEHLDARITADVVGAVVCFFLSKEIDGGGAGRLGVRGHL